MDEAVKATTEETSGDVLAVDAKFTNSDALSLTSADAIFSVITVSKVRYVDKRLGRIGR
jgi:hypothetical protein